MTILLGALFLIVAATGTGIVLSRQPRRQVMAMAVHGLAMTLLFAALQAPDVAFSQLVVGTVAVPLLFLVVLASLRLHRPPPEDGAKPEGGGPG
ncbi:Na(+)/H(+) antiporter subunit B [Roseomonas elaeocarpi]|uniref:Na(+)/H(+) antiporter subunit B n=1 Tax=Roseomonas elaeocarpi TaxID=907779 RepID=A0ABV6JWM8_9PROT